MYPAEHMDKTKQFFKRNLLACLGLQEQKYKEKVDNMAVFHVVYLFISLPNRGMIISGA